MIFLNKHKSTFKLLVRIDIGFLFLLLRKDYATSVMIRSEVTNNFLIVWTLFRNFKACNIYGQLKTNVIQDRIGILAEFVVMVIEYHMLIKILLCAEIFEILRLINRHYMISCKMEQFKSEKSCIKGESDVILLFFVHRIHAKDFLS